MSWKEILAGLVDDIEVIQEKIKNIWKNYANSQDQDMLWKLATIEGLLGMTREVILDYIDFLNQMETLQKVGGKK